ncbi:uncharacterized protein LOC103955964 [Pyrus x bretschneideri]|uniref:uncharacterized protein LOC103955964 n=1 Tax=Pyrus x bretschneideri TaxID=225117 RepID=UPI00202F7A4D|nr:uncharacterized protein LOC103955964 [Pyrus x bretschneideri]
MEKKPTCVLTLLTQVSLCFCLYLAFQLGQPRSSVRHGRSERRPLDLYFISVGGGFRPPTRQTHLLKQMEKVANKYKAEFVVDVSDLGEDDPLMQNGTLHFSTLKVPWYTTRVSEGKGGGYFQKKIKLPYEKTLDVIVVDTGLFQNLTTGSLSEVGNDQLRWLRRTLESTSSNWRVVVGFHSLAICEDGEEGMEATQVFESLQSTFTKFEVNAYLSGQGCASSPRLSSLSYIRNPGKMAAGAYLASVNETSASRRKLEDGFFLHRVGSLEIETCFVTSAGEVVHRSVLHQRGKEIM